MVEATTYSYRHASHGQVVHSSDIGDVRDAVFTGRVAELLNFTLDDLLIGVPGPQIPFVRAELEKGMSLVKGTVAPQPRTDPPPLASQTGQYPLGSFDQRLTEMHDKHAGSPALIIASGPSLETDEAKAGLDRLSAIRAEFDSPIVVGINRARAVYPQCDYLALMDQRLYTENISDHAGWAYLFKGWESRMFVQDIAEWPAGGFIRVRPLARHVGFSFDLCQGFHRGFTTTLLAMQVAAWLGANPIYIAGLDLSHSAVGKTHFFGTVPWNTERDGKSDGTGLFSQMLKTFEAVAPILEARGIKMLNLNPDSAVRCFPFATWDDMLSQKPSAAPAQASAPLTITAE